MVDEMKAKRSIVDPSLFCIDYDEDHWVIVGMFVDDGLVLASDKGSFDRFFKDYRKIFTCTGGEEVKKYVGIQVERHKNGSYKLHQTEYIEAVHKKFLSLTDRPRSNPVDTGSGGALKFLKQQGATTEKEKADVSGKDYMGLLGCLRYITDMTRPDVGFHVSYLGQFLSCPTVENYESALTVLSYLHKTRHIGLTYDGNHVTPLCQSDPAMNMDQLQKEFGLHAWSDASWGTEKNHGGHVIMMCNAAIAWCSRRIKVITLSSTEAEMCAGVGATKDILFVRQILKFLEVGICGPTPLLIDNEGMWHLTKNIIVSKKSRHVELWQHFCRDMFQRRYLSIHLVKGVEERSDLMTKPLPKEAGNYKKFRNDIMNHRDDPLIV